MKTKANYKGICYDVTFDKVFYTSEGIGFILKRESNIDTIIMEVYCTDIRIHIANVGCAIFVENKPRDEGELEFVPLDSNSHTIEEIITMIKKGICTP